MSSTIHNIGINWIGLSKFLDNYAPVIETLENGMGFDGIASSGDECKEEIPGRVEVLYDRDLRVYELRAQIGEGWESSETVLSPSLNSGHMTIHEYPEIQLIGTEAILESDLIEFLVERQLENLEALLDALLGEKTTGLLERIKRLSGPFIF